MGRFKHRHRHPGDHPGRGYLGGHLCRRRGVVRNCGGQLPGMVKAVHTTAGRAQSDRLCGSVEFRINGPLVRRSRGATNGNPGGRRPCFATSLYRRSRRFSDAHLPSVSGNTKDSLGPRPLKRAAQRHQHHAGDGYGGAQRQPAGDVFLPRQEQCRQDQRE